MRRTVSWGGLHNARDLGGLPTAFGMTVFGRVFRSPRLDNLDRTGWAELVIAGIRTIVDLRNDDEVNSTTLRPNSIELVRAPVEDQSDNEFMAEWGTSLGSPAYYAENLRRWPSLIAKAVSAVADAHPCGVVVHCSAGRDRTGLISAILLDVAGVDLAAILDDYEQGVRETNDFLFGLSNPHEKPRSASELEVHVAASRAALSALFRDLNATSYLLSAGVTPAQVERLRARLLQNTLATER